MFTNLKSGSPVLFQSYVRFQVSLNCVFFIHKLLKAGDGFIHFVLVEKGGWGFTYFVQENLRGPPTYFVLWKKRVGGTYFVHGQKTKFS